MLISVDDWFDVLNETLSPVTQLTLYPSAKVVTLVSLQPAMWDTLRVMTQPTEQ